MKTLALLQVFVATAFALPAWAQQPLADPTRPPPAVLAAQAKPAPGAPGPAARTPEEDAARVQMLNVGQQYAIIGGKVVKVGGMVDGSKLVEIRPDAVVLQSPEGVRETVSLYPGVKIRLVAAPEGGEPQGKAKIREDAPRDASKKEKR